jgi:hypothetical protein
VTRRSFAETDFPAKRGGRLELARWLASAEHPLYCARHAEPRSALALLERAWWRSVDNFGILGNSPIHPELLDWLSRAFVESGWSVKDLHRMIMKSAAYQQGSHGPRSLLEIRLIRV